MLFVRRLQSVKRKAERLQIWFEASPLFYCFAVPAGAAAFALRQWRLVLLISGSHTHRMEGMRNILITAEISAPRASIMQMELIISISEISPTPSVAQNITRELVMMELSEAEAAISMAVTRSLPFCSSSRNRVASRIA